MSLFDSGSKAIKFQNPGDTITGTITGTPKEVQQTEFGTDRPAVWPSGDPKMQIIVSLDTQLRDDPDDDGERTLYVASPRMKRAIADAIRKAGTPDVAIGGTLTVTFTGHDPASKNPAQPAKMFTATYQAPSSALASPTPQQAAQPVMTPTAPALTEQQTQQLQSLRAAGLGEQQIAAALGVPVTALA